MSTNQECWLLQNNQPEKPYDDLYLRQMLQQQDIADDDLVCIVGRTE